MCCCYILRCKLWTDVKNTCEAHYQRFTVNTSNSGAEPSSTLNSTVILTNSVDASWYYWLTSAMRKRLVQIFGFVISTLGWVFVLCTLAMDYWRISQLGGQGGSALIRALWLWSNLWKDCATDSTGVNNCRNFPTFSDVTRKCFTGWKNNHRPAHKFCPAMNITFTKS